MKYHIFSCKDEGSDSGQAVIVIAARYSDYAEVIQLLRDKLQELGRSDLLPKLEAREHHSIGNLHVVFSNVEQSNQRSGEIC